MFMGNFVPIDPKFTTFLIFRENNRSWIEGLRRFLITQNGKMQRRKGSGPPNLEKWISVFC